MRQGSEHFADELRQHGAETAGRYWGEDAGDVVRLDRSKDGAKQMCKIQFRLSPYGSSSICALSPWFFKFVSRSCFHMVPRFSWCSFSLFQNRQGSRELETDGISVG